MFAIGEEIYLGKEKHLKLQALMTKFLYDKPRLLPVADSSHFVTLAP